MPCALPRAYFRLRTQAAGVLGAPRLVWVAGPMPGPSSRAILRAPGRVPVLRIGGRTSSALTPRLIRRSAIKRRSATGRLPVRVVSRSRHRSRSRGASASAARSPRRQSGSKLTTSTSGSSRPRTASTDRCDLGDAYLMCLGGGGRRHAGTAASTTPAAPRTPRRNPAAPATARRSPLRHRVRAPAATDDLHRGACEMVLEPQSGRPGPCHSRPPGHVPPPRRVAQDAQRPPDLVGLRDPGASGLCRCGSIDRIVAPQVGHRVPDQCRRDGSRPSNAPSFAQCPHSPAAGSLSSLPATPPARMYRRTRASTPAPVAAPRAPPPPRPRPAPRAHPCARTARARARPPRPPRAA